MIVLQGLRAAVPLEEGGDALRGGDGGGDRRNIRDFILDCRLADVGVIRLAQPSRRGVDHQIDLPVLDCIDDIRTSLVRFQD